VRNLRQRLGCFSVSALRARLAFTIVHVSAGACDPGQSDFPNPVLVSALFAIFWIAYEGNNDHAKEKIIYCWLMLKKSSVFVLLQ